jgi:hypothetical protein
MKMIVRMLGILLTITAAGIPARAQNPSPIVGTWRLVSDDDEIVETKVITHGFGGTGNAMGLLTYTSDGRMNVMIADPARKKPAQTFATDAEAAGLYRTMNAYAGTYRVEGDQIKIHVEMALQQTLVGADLTRSFKLDGDRLTTITPPFVSAVRNNQTLITTIVWERVK